MDRSSRIKSQDALVQLRARQVARAPNPAYARQAKGIRGRPSANEDELARAKRRLLEYSKASGSPNFMQQHPFIVAGASAALIALITRSGASVTMLRMAGFIALRVAAKEFARSLGQRF